MRRDQVVGDVARALPPMTMAVAAVDLVVAGMLLARGLALVEAAGLARILGSVALLLAVATAAAGVLVLSGHWLARWAHLGVAAVVFVAAQAAWVPDLWQPAWVLFAWLWAVTLAVWSTRAPAKPAAVPEAVANL